MQIGQLQRREFITLLGGAGGGLSQFLAALVAIDKIAQDGLATGVPRLTAISAKHHGPI
jgi:hypothetical protein